MKQQWKSRSACATWDCANLPRHIQYPYTTAKTITRLIHNKWTINVQSQQITVSYLHTSVASTLGGSWHSLKFASKSYEHKSSTFNPSLSMFWEQLQGCLSRALLSSSWWSWFLCEAVLLLASGLVSEPTRHQSPSRHWYHNLSMANVHYLCHVKVRLKDYCRGAKTSHWPP